MKSKVKSLIMLYFLELSILDSKYWTNQIDADVWTKTTKKLVNSLYKDLASLEPDKEEDVV